jgi:N-acetylglucosaminyldiphosphoundecaprenol N-acetyl-beta-D-mannosaminyltransferase
MIKKKKLFGYDFVSSNNFSEVIFEIENYKHTPNYLPIVATPNIDQIIKLNRDEELKRIITKSFLILPDGQPIIWLSRFFKKKLLARLSGSDLFPILWKRVKYTKEKVLLIVPSEEVKNRLSIENHKAIFYVMPYFNINDNQYINLVNDINLIIRSELPKYTIIGLSYYKREILCKSLLELNNKNTLYILLGASFEFYLNIKKRAPKWMQKIGLEWFHRFLHEPRRLFKRYFIDSWYLLIIVIKELKL